MIKKPTPLANLGRERYMFRFGILGCGMISNIHADAIKNIENATLHGVCDYNNEICQAFAKKHGVKAYADYNEMLDDKDIDVVCICTPSCFHAEKAIEALKKGKHVVLEKPMALSTEDADRVIAVSKETGKMVTVICQLRFAPDVQKVRNLVKENAFGRISLCGLYMKYYRAKEYYSSSTWKGTIKFDGGGALMNQGIHGVDLLEYIAGSIKNVQGKIATLCHDIETEDTAVATLEFSSGALGVIVASTCAYPGFSRKIEIHGDKGYVILNENKIEKLMIDGKEVQTNEIETSGSASDPTAIQSDMHRLQIENLLSAIEGKEELLIDSNEGKKAVRVIETIYKTSKGEKL